MARRGRVPKKRSTEAGGVDGGQRQEQGEPCAASPHQTLALSHLVQQGALAVEEPLGGAVALEDEEGDPQRKDGEQQQDGQHHRSRVHGPLPSIVHLDDDDLFAFFILAAARAAAHPVPEHGLGVARLHLQLLVVELPVAVPLVEIGESCGARNRRTGGEEKKRELSRDAGRKGKRHTAVREKWGTTTGASPPHFPALAQLGQ